MFPNNFVDLSQDDSSDETPENTQVVVNYIDLSQDVSTDETSSVIVSINFLHLWHRNKIIEEEAKQQKLLKYKKIRRIKKMREIQFRLEHDIQRNIDREKIKISYPSTRQN